MGSTPLLLPLREPGARTAAPRKGIIEDVQALTFGDARDTVLRTVRERRTLPSTEIVPLSEAAGRVLAREAVADRDLPALSRSVRDGYAIRAADVPGELEIAGEVRAGERYSGRLA